MSLSKQLFTAIFISCFISSSCTTPKLPPKKSYDPGLSQEMDRQVNSSDGINRSEAQFIARAFFNTKISGCGFPESLELKRYFWVSQTRIGLVGDPGPPIYIHRKTGAITWGKKYKSYPLDELKKGRRDSYYSKP